MSATQSVSVLTEMAVREENFSFSWLIGNLLIFYGNEGSVIAFDGNQRILSGMNGSRSAMYQIYLDGNGPGQPIG
jgi:hypothetical protein